MTQAPRQTTRWIVAEAIPIELRTSAFMVVPLQETHAELDYRAFMSCRARLRKELQWGDWPPPDFTLHDSRDDLRDHFGEFTRGEAFAYTMLRPDLCSKFGT